MKREKLQLISQKYNHNHRRILQKVIHQQIGQPRKKRKNPYKHTVHTNISILNQEEIANMNRPITRIKI